MATTTTAVGGLDERIERPSEGQWTVVFRRFRRHRMAMISVGVLILMFGASIVAPWIAPFPRDEIGLSRVFVKPMATDPATGQLHILGTDQLGRDYFTRLLYAARVSLFIALTTATVATLIGIVLGLLAGYYGGWVDIWITRTLEFVSTFPAFTILLILSAALIQNEALINVPRLITYPLSIIMAVSERESKQVFFIIIVLALLGWTGDARLMRGQVLSVREQPYVESSRALGASNRRIIGRHVFPNAYPPLIVSYTLALNAALVGESALSFLGFGIQDPTPTWGNMLAFTYSYMFQQPWLPLVPGLPLLLASLAFNYIGDGLRDALDPRAKR